ncbi:FAD dependent oxidoreductase-domain-containing protein [Microdochium trichocladiopsis]|uniref:FAD dependent oxidoreductase-domain-containing protein n=1 Tax=Microdochium trichocladiopsis TaxID=1682393 RepID=A0A9P8YA13_9PEZI|nr:FAD dependent oxidoreductase-domain-containing protein [Microdochium trichocladiopsis]KAH7031514.1 FAD dependent oxidoreductase-domain-containing protein [Microdochium trichocladiopsis]
MGVVLSTLAGAASALRMLLEPVLSFSKALERAGISPGLPVLKPTTPYWTRDPPHPELVKQQSSSLPTNVDVAIIGSGISGAAVAHSLLLLPHSGSESAAGPSIAVLEARDICSGATARNGGHIKTAPWAAYTRLAKHVGKERAAVLTRFQRRHLDVLLALCRDTEIGDAAEAREVETVDLFLDAESFAAAAKDVAETAAALPEEKMTVWEREEAQKKFGTGPSIYGAISYRAGALWPYRMVTSIWQRLLAAHPDRLSIETHTPVESISVNDGVGGGPAPETHPYALHTPRGTVYARNVVHATNGHASHLVPGLRRKITPVRAHMSAQKPGLAFPADHGAHRSWSVVYGENFDYVTQRPPDVRGGDGGGDNDREEAGGGGGGGGVQQDHQGDLMIGGGFDRSLKKGIDMVAVADDGAPLDAVTLAHIAGVFPAVFSPNWGIGSGLRQAWSGILGFTGDLLPLVGKLDTAVTGRTPAGGVGDPSGQGEMLSRQEWIVAGCAGEGMVWCWLAGVALGIMMSGREGEELAAAPGRPAGRVLDWLPRELHVSKERLKSADLSNLPAHI